MISLSLELRWILRMPNTSSNLYHIQGETFFRLLEINFLISIILGMALCTRTKTKLVIQRKNIQLDLIKIQTKMYKRNYITFCGFHQQAYWVLKKFLLFLLFLCIFNRVEKLTKIQFTTLPRNHLIFFSKQPGQNDKLTGTPEPNFQIGTVPVKPRRMFSLPM